MALKNAVSRALLLLTLLLYDSVGAQDYEVADIDCFFGSSDHSPNGISHGEGERLTAILKKPEGFRGYPTFADDRTVDPRTDPHCQIKGEQGDPTGLIFRLHISDFKKCGVLIRNGFVNVRIWFPQLPGIVMMSDQEVIIMCKPPQTTIVENMAAGFASSIPNHGRISGIVEESPGRLEYVVALYRETTTKSGDFVLPVNEPVPIGTRLQLRATINTQSAWKFAKLMDVTVSGSHEDPLAPGHVILVQNGCRNGELVHILPSQPSHAERLSEVSLVFEAFQLVQSGTQHTPIGFGQIWIHASIKACTYQHDCSPEFCLDLYQPSGHGRRRRSLSADQRMAMTSISRGPLETRLRHLVGPGPSATPLPLHAAPGPLLTSTSTPGGPKGPSSGKDLSLPKPPGGPRLANGAPRTTQDPMFLARTPSTTPAPPHFSSSEAHAISASLRMNKDIGENIGLTVLMPEDSLQTASRSLFSKTCDTYIIISAVLCGLLLLSGVLMCILACKLRSAKQKRAMNDLRDLYRSHRSRSMRPKMPEAALRSSKRHPSASSEAAVRSSKRYSSVSSSASSVQSQPASSAKTRISRLK